MKKVDEHSAMAKPDRVLAYGRQCIEEDDKQAVLAVLDSDWLTQGPMVEQFERVLSDYFGTEHAVACANGTAALHLAAIALGWGPGDVVIVPAITFLASANCCAFVGAQPYFVDIDERSLTIDPNEVERHVKALLAAGKRVRGIVGVDLAGHACDWPALRQIADRYELDLLDDACHAMGGTYRGNVRVGSCSDADATVLSFHPVKHITTGEGGAVLTNDSRVAETLGQLRSHGMVRGAGDVSGWEGPWHYDMQSLGFNYRLTDIQAALGVSQMKKLDRFVAARREIARWYDEILDQDHFVLPTVEDGVSHAYHLYVLRTKFGDSGSVDRREFFARSSVRGVQLQVHYRPVPLNSYYASRPENRDVASRLPVSMRYYAEAFSIPMFPQLSREEVEYVTETLEAALKA